jgi:hypothetical protein
VAEGESVVSVAWLVQDDEDEEDADVSDIAESSNIQDVVEPSED